MAGPEIKLMFSEYDDLLPGDSVLFPHRSPASTLVEFATRAVDLSKTSPSILILTFGRHGFPRTALSQQGWESDVRGGGSLEFSRERPYRQWGDGNVARCTHAQGYA